MTLPPSPWLVLAPPFGIVVGVVLVAALHDALGSPLGAAFAAEVWGLGKMFIAPAIATTAFGVYVVRNNERAWRERERAQLRQEVPTEPDPWTRSIENRAPPRKPLRSGSYRALPPADWSVMVEDEEDERS